MTYEPETDEHVQRMIDESIETEREMLAALIPSIRSKDGRVVLAALFGLTAGLARALSVPPEMYTEMATTMMDGYSDILAADARGVANDG